MERSSTPSDLDDLERDAAGDARQFLRSLELQQRAEQAHDIGPEPGAQARFDLFAGAGIEMLVGQDPDPRIEDPVAGLQPRHGVAHPADRAVIRQHQRGVGSLGEPVGAGADLACQRLAGRIAQGLGLRACPPGDPARNGSRADGRYVDPRR